MTAKRRKYPAGLTFIEIIIATVVLVIAVLGTSAFRYSTALSARKADLQATAARTALLLCESWRGASDPCTFNPEENFGVDSVLSISNGEYGPYPPEGFTLLGHYEIEIRGDAVDDETYYWATLSWKDMYPGLRALNVVVTWNQRGSRTEHYWYADKSFRLTTFITD
ncbi:MAG: type IV pilus modification PilV family protein [Planctomycetota bacterium]|jgi:hypothetical protein